MKPKISFVMPCYNKAAYISDTLKGCIAQSLKEIEIICVCDCPTDGTDEIIKFYAKKDKRVKLFELPENKGMSYARNYGITKAKADIICSQDADDISHPERAKLVYDYFKKSPNTTLVYTGFYAIDELGHVVREFSVIKFNPEYLYSHMTTYMGHPTFAYKRKIILKNPYTLGEWSRLGCEDYKLILDWHRKGYQIGWIDKPLVFYRQLESGSTVTRNPEEVLKIKTEYLKSLGVTVPIKENPIKGAGDCQFNIDETKRLEEDRRVREKVLSKTGKA